MEGAFCMARSIPALHRSATTTPRRAVADRIGDCADMIRCRPATSAYDVQPSVPCPFLELGGQAFRRLRKTSRRKRIRQPGIRVSARVAGGTVRQLFDV